MRAGVLLVGVGLQRVHKVVWSEYNQTVGRNAVGLAYAVVMICTIVGLDVLFFRGHPWPRLAVNVGIVLVFGAFYLRFLKQS